MVAIFALTLYFGHWTTVTLFFLLSFLALREFITLNETRGCDHKVLFWCFFVILPLQYFLVGIQWYGLASIFIPVYAFIFIPIRKVMSVETTFPIDLFLLMGDNYVGHDELGRACHAKRKMFEMNLARAGMTPFKQTLYKQLAALGVGRDVFVVARKAA